MWSAMSSQAEQVSQAKPVSRPRARPRATTFKDAINDALDVALAADPRVIVLGEDISGGAGLGDPYEGAMGGSFGATKGLFEKYGPQRVRDTPISEAAIVGAAVGAALAGLRPVVDLMWSSFSPYCFDQIVNQAAKIRYMFGGQASVPIVLRMAVGAGMRAAGQHSDTFQSIFAAIPGLKVVVPATTEDAKGLLLASIRDDNPVMFLEHMSLYRLRGAIPPGDQEIPLGSACTVRAGRDITVATVGSMLHVVTPLCQRLSDEGIEVEVLDLRSLSPLDLPAILESVGRTKRLAVVDESPPACSVASYIAALVSEKLFGQLAAPVACINTASSPVPFSPPLEDAYLPTSARVEQVIRRLMG